MIIKKYNEFISEKISFKKKKEEKQKTEFRTINGIFYKKEPNEGKWVKCKKSDYIASLV